MTTIHAREWLNTDQPLSLADFRGKVLAVEVFQMLCPGCVSHGLPQASRIASTFAPDKVAVIGLHSVFEHHDAMTPTALRAFLHEYRKPAAQLSSYEAARLAVMLPRPKYFEKLPNSSYVSGRAAIIADRLGSAALP